MIWLQNIVFHQIKCYKLLQMWLGRDGGVGRKETKRYTDTYKDTENVKQNKTIKENMDESLQDVRIH